MSLQSKADHIPPDLMRLDIHEVSRIVGRSPSSLREMRREGRFPEPDYRDGPRCVRWSAGLVRRWLEATTIQVKP